MKYLFHERNSYCRYRKLLLIMRLTMFFIMAFIFTAGAKGTAQTVTLSVSNMPLERVCKEIEQKTGFYFVYAKEMSKTNYLVTASVNNAELNDVLKQIFGGSPFSFQIIDKVIIISNVRKNSVTLDRESTLNGKLITVEGVVLSEQGQPLVGATVTVKATKNSISTNEKGEFTLKGIPENSILIITSIGFSPRQVTVKGELMRVVLEVATNELDAAVIKGYYSTSNRMNTGDVSVVKGDDIRKQPVTDPIQALSGRVPGLYIQQTSGVPGAYAKIQLRGLNSLANGADPFYIIDGVPYSNLSLTSSYNGSGALGVPSSNRPGSAPVNNGLGLSPFNNLNPSDIESIVVLKDADATAIYGSRGANGVILITTKRGKIGQTKVDADVSAGAGKVSHFLKMMNTQQYLQMRREAFKNDGALPNPNTDFDLTFWDTTRYTNWQKVLIGNTARFQRAQASISGGNANTQFLISTGYSDQGSVYPGNYYDKKASLHLNLANVSTNQRFNSLFSLSYVNDNNNLPTSDFTQNIVLAPNTPSLYDDNKNLNWQLKGGTATFINPLASTRNRAKAVTDNFVSNLELKYQVIPGLQVKSNFGYVNSKIDQSELRFSNSFQPPFNTRADLRRNLAASAYNKSWIIEPQISFSRHLGKGFIEALLGTTFQESVQQSNGQSVSGFSSDALVPNPVAGTSFSLTNYFINRYHYIAQYGRLGFTYQDKYLLNLTIRRDGSSRFGPGRQFGTFGAVGGGWIFSNENFIQKNVPWLSFGKMRASYGVTGNDQLPDYKFLDTYSSYTGGTYQGTSGLFPTQLTNAYYAWEKSYKLEGGLEFGFLKDRVFASVSYYRNRTDNQLVQYTLPYITGFSGIQYNLPALIQNSGLEVIVNTTNMKYKRFEWATSVNLSIPRNRLLAYPNIASSPYAYSYVVGRSLDIAYVYNYSGVDPQTGLYRFYSLKGDGNPTSLLDRVVVKGISKRYFGGLSNRLTFGGFQIDFLLQFVKQTGAALFLPVQPGIYNYNQLYTSSPHWIKTGDHTGLERYSQKFSNEYSAYSNLQLSNMRIVDASFVRVKNVSVSYLLSAHMSDKLRLKNARFHIEAQNLFTVTPYTGLDPESQSFSLPPLRMISGGIQVGL